MRTHAEEAGALLALVILDTVVVALLAVLVAGLLRSHADILRALHSLGAGVGDPADPGAAADTPPVDAAPVPRRVGPPLPGERSSSTAHDLSGESPEGGAVVVAVRATRHFTLLAFLSSGCATCATFWEALTGPGATGLPDDVRPVVVTKGPDLEIPAEVAARSRGRVAVVMSSRAWDDYEVPGSPFFVLVDGRRDRRIGEGVANRLDQVVDLVRRARVDAGAADPAAAPTDGTRGRALASGLDGRARESLNDRELRAGGIHPGHPSLYPRSLDDIFAAAGPSSPARPDAAAGHPRPGGDPAGDADRGDGR